MTVYRYYIINSVYGKSVIYKQARLMIIMSVFDTNSPSLSRPHMVPNCALNCTKPWKARNGLISQGDYPLHFTLLITYDNGVN